MTSVAVVPYFGAKVTLGNMSHPCHLYPLRRGGDRGGYKTEGSNTIMSTSFALKFWSNKTIDVDIILSITLIVS